MTTDACANDYLTLTVEPEHYLVPWMQPQPREADANGSPTRAIRCESAFGAALAHPAWLPFANGSFARVRLRNQLEHVLREEELLAEIGRVVRPGGVLELRVPAAGPLAGFDAMNLTRYLIDVTHIGRRPIETSEIGWRKHYSERDLAMMLDKAGFDIVASTRSRFVVSEMLEFSARVVFHWAGDNEAAFERVNRAIDRIRGVEDHLRFGDGFLLSATARKRAETKQ